MSIFLVVSGSKENNKIDKNKMETKMNIAYFLKSFFFRFDSCTSKLTNEAFPNEDLSVAFFEIVLLAFASFDNTFNLFKFKAIVNFPRKANLTKNWPLITPTADIMHKILDVESSIKVLESKSITKISIKIFPNVIASDSGNTLESFLFLTIKIPQTALNIVRMQDQPMKVPTIASLTRNSWLSM